MNRKEIYAISILICFLIILGGCADIMDKEKTIEELMNTDRTFSELSLEQGSVLAFYHYMADDGIVLPQQGHPLNKGSYGERLAQAREKPAQTILTWEPIKADVAESADMDYTHGKYELVTTDSTGCRNKTYGYYITIWKKQPDGSWKFVFDTGNKIISQLLVLRIDVS